MPRTCTVCQNGNRAAIDAALVAGKSIAAIARDNAVSEDALSRHRAHLPRALVVAEKAAEVTRADTLLDQVQDLQARALTILATAEASGDLRTALGAIREARGNLELLGKLAGELAAQPTINVLVSAEWQLVRATVVAALAPYPDAAVAVAAALTRCGDAV